VTGVVVEHLQVAVAAERQEAKRWLLDRRRDLRHHDSLRVKHLEPRPVQPCRCHRPVCCWGELPVGVARVPDVDVGGDLVAVKLQGVEWRGGHASHGRDEVRRQCAMLAPYEFVRRIVRALPRLVRFWASTRTRLPVLPSKWRACVQTCHCHLSEVSEENKNNILTFSFACFIRNTSA
jgi:hypothetical protein